MSRRHAGAQGGRLHVVVDEPRQRDEEADLIPLTWPEDPTVRPYLDGQGALVLPINCEKRLRWWAGGQSVERTRAEIAR